ncbi:uncharacterized protein [Anabrus simplex]|uniref:uncharacterized protein n=1 Tax=Anabrus simplex TaxID=316456 RepID=UPI0035A2EBC1
MHHHTSPALRIVVWTSTLTSNCNFVEVLEAAVAQYQDAIYIMYRGNDDIEQDDKFEVLSTKSDDILLERIDIPQNPRAPDTNPDVPPTDRLRKRKATKENKEDKKRKKMPAKRSERGKPTQMQSKGFGQPK